MDDDRTDYRLWADAQRRLHQNTGGKYGLDDETHAEALRRLKGGEGCG